MTLHLIAALTGALAAGLLLWRLIGCWPDTSPLVHVLGILLAVSIVLGAGVLLILPPGDSATAVTVEWLLLIHRLVCIAVAIMWPTWLDRSRAPAGRIHPTGA